MAEVLIPGLLKLRLMLLHKLQERRQFMAAEPGGTGQTHRVKPELGIAFSVLHVNVGWLLAPLLKKKKRKPSARSTVGIPRTYAVLIANERQSVTAV